jgi:hypothetical protein
VLVVGVSIYTVILFFSGLFRLLQFFSVIVDFQLDQLFFIRSVGIAYRPKTDSFPQLFQFITRNQIFIVVGGFFIFRVCVVGCWVGLGGLRLWSTCSV